MNIRKRDRITAWLIIFLGGILFYYLDARITPTTSQNLVVFFSIIFGFYITSITTLFGSSYAKYLHKNIDPKFNMRSIYILKAYITASGYLLILSFCLVLLFSIVFHVDVNENSVLSHGVNIPFISKPLNADKWNRVFSAVILGISSTNVFWMIRIFKVVLGGLIEEARRE